jgi:hypothetical protein
MEQTVVDMHGHFEGHGIDSAESWYSKDCVHPNADGNVELTRLFYEEITGVARP